MFLTRKKFWKRLIILALTLPILLASIGIGLVYYKQDDIVQGLLETVNKDFNGKLEIKDSHISPFTNFPYISIDLEEVKIFEDKSDSSAIIADLNEVFLGFDFWQTVGGRLDINDIKLKDGYIHLVQHLDGNFNLSVALSSDSEVAIDSTAESMHLAIHEIEIENVDINKLNEENQMMLDAFIQQADAKFSTSNEHTAVHFDSRFELNIIQEGDTSFIKHKHFDLDTELDYNTLEEILTLEPTKIHLENAEFDMKGFVNFKDDMYVDFTFNGNKDNYDLIFAMAPEELIPTLKRYENKGRIFFETNVKGKTANGQMPAINATFGCENGFFKNTVKNKQVDDLNFTGSFTNGTAKDFSTMKLILNDFTAKPEEGQLLANLEITNFDDPEIEFQINSSFELDFLAEFFNLTDLKDLGGAVELEMNFHDIVNIDAPEHAISKLNESYKSVLRVTDLTFNYGEGVPVDDLDLLVDMNGHKAVIEYFDLKMGNSDVNMQGEISDLPAILHHTDQEIETKLDIKSNFIDLFELTGLDSNALNEKIKDFQLGLNFKSSAVALTEYKNLPVGEFFIQNLHANLQNYPHELHDFNLDILIDEENFQLINFKGEIDKSDFLFSGNLKHYDIWFADTLRGDTKIDFDFESNHLRLEDLLAYNGENYVPEEYQHEELNNLKFHGNTQIHFQDSLEFIDFNLNHFNAKMNLHPLEFQEFSTNIHYEDDYLKVNNFTGKLGQSDFNTSLHYYLGNNEALDNQKNHFSFTSSFLDVDELTNYNLHSSSTAEEDSHDSVFNIYELPFTNMTFDVDIHHMNYHHYMLDELNAKAHTTPNHYLYIDTLSVGIAGGRISTNGYFNGSNPNSIYFSPSMFVDKIDLDKLFFKFDNFGQDYLLSENVHGEFTGQITGKIHMHTDLVPKLDDSEIHVTSHIENGRLENFAMLDSFADYFRGQNIETVRFDTLDNVIDFLNGTIAIEKMTVNSTLGFLEVSGKQDTDFNFEYKISVPWKMVTKATASKLFKRKQEKPQDIESEIQYAKKNTKYVTVKLVGDSIDYSVSLARRKK